MLSYVSHTGFWFYWCHPPVNRLLAAFKRGYKAILWLVFYRCTHAQQLFSPTYCSVQSLFANRNARTAVSLNVRMLLMHSAVETIIHYSLIFAHQNSLLYANLMCECFGDTKTTIILMSTRKDWHRHQFFDVPLFQAKFYATQDFSVKCFGHAMMMKKRDESSGGQMMGSSGSSSAAVHHHAPIALPTSQGVISMWPPNAAEPTAARIFLPAQHIVKQTNTNVAYVQVIIVELKTNQITIIELQTRSTAKTHQKSIIIKSVAWKRFVLMANDHWVNCCTNGPLLDVSPNQPFIINECGSI